MKNRPPRSSWSLSDIIDFEALADKPATWRKSWNSRVSKKLKSHPPVNEQNKRNIAFRWMLDDVKKEQLNLPGARVQTASSLITVGLCALMLLIGIGVVRSLISPFSFYEYDGAQTQNISLRGFNAWILLAVSLGLQWLFLIISLLSYLLWRKWSGHLSFLQTILSAGIQKISGLKSTNVTSGEYSRVWKWRLTRIIQASGIAYNAGLIIGLFGCLWFLKVGYYWETSLPQFGEQSLQSVTALLSFPAGEAIPSQQAIDYTNLAATARENNNTNQSISPRDQAYLSWTSFFFIALITWGLLPRVIFWIIAITLERKSYAGLSFQEARHRSLWREVTKVQRGEVSSSPADGVVLLDVGGLETTTDELRPFLLQTLRVNPESRFSLGTLDETGEKEALIKAQEAAMGVIFIVEGWNLSPKQMQIYHDKVRDAIGQEHMVRYLVLGKEDEFHEWMKFVDSMKDPATETYLYSQAS